MSQCSIGQIRERAVDAPALEVSRFFPPGYSVTVIKAGKRYRYTPIAPDGTSLGTVSSTLSLLDRMDQHQHQQRLQERACLCCSTIFDSTGPGHRLCDPCRERPEGLI